MKTLQEKEKMLVTSIFSFSHHVFYPYQIKFQFFKYIYFVMYENAFNLDQSKIWSFGKEHKTYTKAKNILKKQVSLKHHHQEQKLLMIVSLSSWYRHILKALWQGDKLLVKSNLSFCHQCLHTVLSFILWMYSPGNPPLFS